MSKQRLVITATALALAVAACSSGGTGDQAGGTGSTATTTASGSPGPNDGTTSAPTPSADHHDSKDDGGSDGDGHASPFPANTSPDTGQASAGAFGNVTDIRLGHHDGYDRVVFEFQGAGTPGWTVQYVPQALSQGSGQPVPVSGSAVLSVALTGVGNPPDTGVQEVARGPVSVHDTHVVTEAYFDGTFEGVSQAFIGTTGQQPFRTYLLTGPARVVVEVVSP